MNGLLQALDHETAPCTAEVMVEDLLLQIELAETEEEEGMRRSELENLVNTDGEAAKVYVTHLMLEEQLRRLAGDPDSCLHHRSSGPRSFFQRLRLRFLPGPMG